MSALNLKPQIKTVDMSEEMTEFAIETATFALGEYNIESLMANHIKREFDKKYSPTWHVVIGTNYGSHVVHATKHFIYFYLGPKAILIFKSG
mmetsp:Transcript_46618/g.129579  ORF Transcript_46618/g.129579 Transcript_46618/m.129579 type:complete len:92 (-) Transcript_46618:293-568(-)